MFIALLIVSSEVVHFFLPCKVFPVSSLVIRKAREYDMEPVADLCRESLRETFGDQAHLWSGDQEIYKYFRGNWPDMLVVQEESKLAGFACLKGEKIDVFWVGMAFRRHGVGRELLDAVEKQVATGHPRISVECFVPDQRTIKFFESRGYTIEREYTDQISNVGKVVMGRLLESLS